MTGLTELGWTAELDAAFAGHGAAGRRPARVTVEHQHAYTIRTADGEGTAAVSGRYRFEANGPEDFPAVGDWVAIDGGLDLEASTIHALLPRRSAFTRLAAGKRPDGQVIAANVDVILIAMGLDGDFNLRRLERYLAVGWSSGAMPVVVLTKADRCADVDGHVVAVAAVAPGVPVLAISAITGLGMDALGEHLGPGRTAAVLGSSGVGKSTLVNALLGTDALATAAVRAGDDRGRHTTTHRELDPAARWRLHRRHPGHARARPARRRRRPRRGVRGHRRDRERLPVLGLPPRSASRAARSPPRSATAG